MLKTQLRTKRKRNKGYAGYYFIIRDFSILLFISIIKRREIFFFKVLIHRRIWQSKTNERTVKSTQLEIETSLVNKEDIIHSTKLPDACWWRTCISPRSNLSARHVRVIILHVSRQWKNKNFWPYAHAHKHIYTCTQQIHTHTNVCVHARSRSVSVCFNCYRPSRVLPKTRMGYWVFLLILMTTHTHCPRLRSFSRIDTD